MGATATVEELVTRAVADGFQSLALTDRDALYGAVTFSKACGDAAIQPILGITVHVEKPDEMKAIPLECPGDMVLLAQNASGYRSLCRLSSLLLGNPQRLNSHPRALTWAELVRNQQGLACIEGGKGGWLASCLGAGDLEIATRYLARFSGYFANNGYLSLEIHDAEDHAIAEAIVGLGVRFGVPSLSIQPIYSLSPEDRPRLHLLAAIQHNCPLDELPATALPACGDPGVNLHWLSPGEIANRFADFPDALTAVGELVKHCEPALPDGRPIWPTLDLPNGQTADEALTLKALEGLKAKFGREIDPSIQSRLTRELELIARRSFAPLFLIVADAVSFARRAEIPVNTRGSVANSLVAYCIGITNVDPIEHDLMFERFLNPARADLPDIDLDFCSRRRDEVLEYIRNAYGEDHVALVATINTMRLRSAVRETAKAYGFDEQRIKKLSAKLPRGGHPDPRRRDQRSLEDMLGDLKDGREQAIVKAAYRIVGQPRHLSVHPGGVVLTPGSLTDHVPVQWAPKGFLITQFDHKDVEAIGLPKMDLLGIRALTVLADASAWVRCYHQPDFSLEKIPLEDRDTGDLISRGETIGVFQCESQGAQRSLRQLQARTVRGMAIANAFFKPGPATGGMAQSFIRRYRGEEPVSYLHPALEPILGSTKGVLIFQEQVLRLAREIAGLSWEEANHIRRGMSKFRSEEMESMRTKFVAGCRRSPPEGPGFSLQQAAQLWEQVVAFAGYGFNQGHATAYAGVSYRSAFLKAHWPETFLCARLANRGGYHHPAVYMAEAIRLGIQVRPPHINHSRRKFTLAYEAGKDGSPTPVLWMGLDQVRDLRRKSIHEIVTQRDIEPYDGLWDFLGRVSLQKREITHLIQCGGLDGFGASRAELYADSQRVIKVESTYQRSFAWMETPSGQAETRAQRLAWEKHILGLPVSVHPLATVVEGLDDMTPLHKLPDTVDQRAEVVGARLPGWTGGQGFFLSDGENFVVVKLASTGLEPIAKPEVWKPIRLRGRWQTDEWGGGWYQAEEIRELAFEVL
jgi:DNA-directed DNA polymerase III PolC